MSEGGRSDELQSYNLFLFPFRKSLFFPTTLSVLKGQFDLYLFEVYKKKDKEEEEEEEEEKQKAEKSR